MQRFFIRSSGGKRSRVAIGSPTAITLLLATALAAGFIYLEFTTTVGMAFHNDPPARSVDTGVIARAQDSIPGQYIVLLDDRELTSKRLAVSDAANLLAGEFGGIVGKQFETALRGFVIQLDDAEAQQLSGHPLVRLVEQDGLVELAQSQSNPTWGLDRSDQRRLPLDHSYGYSSTASTVDAYVIDTGIRISHAEFGGRAFPVFDAVGDGNGSTDCHGHGTHVAGIIGGATFGIAKNVNLYSVRVLNCSGQGQISNVIAAIDWITANRSGPSVVNISITAAGSVPSMEEAVANSVAAGIVYTVAAGNYAGDACSYSPARTPAAITVAASAASDGRALYSNHGTCVDLFAPGDEITSAGIASDTATRTMNGTSMSAPHAAGAVALYLEAHPSQSPALVTAALAISATSGIVTGTQQSPNLLLFTDVRTPSCNGTLFAGTTATSNDVMYFPNENGRRSQGAHGYLSIPGGESYVLALETKRGSKWAQIAGVTGSTPIDVEGRQMTYRWRVQAVTGGGNFALCSSMP